MADPLVLVREQMEKLGLSAFYLPHKDPHNNEYLASHDSRMPWLSGFSGSNGEMLVTASQALLWTDGRYWLAAEKQLKKDWTLMKYQAGVPRYNAWAVQNLPKGSTIGYDPAIMTASAAKNMISFFEKEGFTFQSTANIVNDVWEARPPLSKNQVIKHEEEYTQDSFAVKRERAKEKLGEKTKILITNVLDEIAWILNLRGSDIEFNPLFFSYLYLDFASPRTVLFCDGEKLADVGEYLAENQIEVLPYEEVNGFIQAVEEPVSVDEARLNYALYQGIKNPVAGPSILTQLKAIKNEREIRGFRESHMRDAIALCKYIARIKNDIEDHREHTEYTGALLLAELRAVEEFNKGASFETISAVGPNAAVIHYKPMPETALKITSDQIYLLDSGGHYLDGTIDTTRTMHFGIPSDWEKECYTRVLLGNLDLERVTWPASSQLTGGDLDILARRRLWQQGLNYNHGTGHGVGYYLNVHEGPQGISKFSTVKLEPGMTVTDEPGYYEEGRFGIRIENLLIVIENVDYDGFLKFENVTLVPYDKNLIDIKLLSERDIEYIDKYHELIWETLSPVLRDRDDLYTLEWLEIATSPLI